MLCHQPLDEEAVARFGRFKKFMEDATNTVLAAKRNALTLLRDRVDLWLPCPTRRSNRSATSSASMDAKVADDLRSYHARVAKRKAAALALLREGEDPQKAACCHPGLRQLRRHYESVAQALYPKATDITNAAKPEEYKKPIAKVAERQIAESAQY